MDIETLRKRKKELGLTNRQVADFSGVPLPTVQKIFSGATKSPQLMTVLALEKALGVSEEYLIGPVTPSYVGEAAFEYEIPAKKQGEYTVEDFYAMPETWRGELIDGYLYGMSEPSPKHQMIATSIGQQLLNYLDEQEGACHVIASPVNVQLDGDDKTMLAPDVTIVCDRAKILDNCVFGAPDLIMEILSPATRKRDLTIKLHKYLKAGVREYWIIDPKNERVLVYQYGGEDIIDYYTFDSAVPVGIWGGACEVDFKKVKKYVL